jgi:hypothetical protein
MIYAVTLDYGNQYKQYLERLDIVAEPRALSTFFPAPNRLESKLAGEAL